MALWRPGHGRAFPRLHRRGAVLAVALGVGLSFAVSVLTRFAVGASVRPAVSSAAATGTGVTSFSYRSSPGDVVGNGAVGTLVPSRSVSFVPGGSAGGLSLSVTTPSQTWHIDLVAPTGAQLLPGVYRTRSPRSTQTRIMRASTSAWIPECYAAATRRYSGASSSTRSRGPRRHRRCARRVVYPTMWKRQFADADRHRKVRRSGASADCLGEFQPRK